MDVSLCCLVLRNICSGVSMPDIDTIRDVRNQLIHASNASLDATLYLATWSKVEAAMLNLAQGVSSSFRSDTISAVQALKNRLIDTSELSALKDLVMDEKRITEDEKRISEIEKIQDATKVELAQHKERFCHVEHEIEIIQKDQAALMSGILQQKDFPEERTEELKQILLESYEKATQKIQVSPLQKTSKKLPLDMIFAPVVIRQDLEDKTTKSNQDDSTPNVKTQQVRNPKDMFYKNGKPVRHIFMQGEAAHGKTVFCKRLLQHWCASKRIGANKEDLTDWEKSLDEYDFVFFVMFRLVNKNTISIDQMILDELSQHSLECVEAIRHVLSNRKYRCLIIMDGLDEWRISQKQKKNLRHKRFPNTGNLSKKCSLFITFRPWVYDVIADLMEDCDRVVDICGLDEKGITLLIEKMLINFYNMDTASEQYNETWEKMIKKSKDENLKSIMEIPLLLTASVMLWFEKEQTDLGSMTNFYISLVQLLIKKAFDTESLDEDLIDRLVIKPTSGIQIPDILQKARNKPLRKFIGVLDTLGKLAYDDLLSNETNLVFGKEELEDKIDEDDMEFALRVGLLSQCEAPGCFDEENVSVNFFHKTVQEFLAALHVICNVKEILKEFCSHLQSIDRMFDLSNVVMFLSGLSPSVGDDLSKHVASLADKDTDICAYRESFPDYSFKVIQLYRFQIRCDQEMKSHEKLPPNDRKVIRFYGKDIISTLVPDAKSIVQYTSEILRHHPHISTLSLRDVHTNGENSKDITALFDCLASSKTLHSIRLHSRKEKIISNFGMHLPLKHLYLDNFVLTEDACHGIFHSVKSSLHLKKLSLLNVTLSTKSDSPSLMSQSSWLQDLFQVLPESPNLTTLEVDSKTLQHKKNAILLMDVLPKLTSLHTFWYNGSNILGLNVLSPFERSFKFGNSLKNVRQLRHLTIRNVNLRNVPPGPEEENRYLSFQRHKSQRKNMNALSCREVKPFSSLQKKIMIDPRLTYHQPFRFFSERQLQDSSVELTSTWTNLEMLELCLVYMSPFGWYKFLVSLLDIPHSFYVVLNNTDIDDESVRMICSNPFIFIRRPQGLLSGTLEFTKVFKKILKKPYVDI